MFARAGVYLNDLGYSVENRTKLSLYYPQASYLRAKEWLGNFKFFRYSP